MVAHALLMGPHHPLSSARALALIDQVADEVGRGDWGWKSEVARRVGLPQPRVSKFINGVETPGNRAIGAEGAAEWGFGGKHAPIQSISLDTASRYRMILRMTSAVRTDSPLLIKAVERITAALTPLLGDEAEPKARNIVQALLGLGGDVYAELDAIGGMVDADLADAVYFAWSDAIVTHRRDAVNLGLVEGERG